MTGYSLGKNIGGEIMTRSGSVVAATGSQVNTTSQVIDLLAVQHPQSVTGLVFGRANLDSGDTLTINNISVQGSADSGFTTPVDLATAANVVLTGASGQTDVDYFGQVQVDVDLTRAAKSLRYLRIRHGQILSDNANTTGSVASAFIFGGMDKLPAA